MPGGFAGVDVFFVISGFLMTGVIFKGFEQKNFSILKFYISRANRIIPALAVLCLTLVLLGWLILTPLDYRVLGKHVVSSMTFLSNIVYLRESGYFDTASNEKWLLHTWSLSVEWQFYIIYPLILVVVKRLISLKNILFIDSSHIEHTHPYVKSFNSEYNIYYLTMGGCVIDSNFEYYYKDSTHLRPWYTRESLNYLDQVLR